MPNVLIQLIVFAIVIWLLFSYLIPQLPEPPQMIVRIIAAILCIWWLITMFF